MQKNEFRLSISTVTAHAHCGSTSQWGAADAEIKVQSDENTELKGSPFKTEVGQYIAIHATLTARDFFLSLIHI